MLLRVFLVNGQGKEKLDERHPWFEKCKEWLEYRLDFYLKALAYVDHPEKIKRQSGGKNKEYIEAAMTCARLHIAPSRLNKVQKEAKQQRADAAAAVRQLLHHYNYDYAELLRTFYLEVYLRVDV